MNARRGFILAAVVALGVATAYWLPDKLNATLPVTSLVASSDGQWRDATLLSGVHTRVVVHHNVKWCTCPGLGVVSQITTQDIDSAFAVAHALFVSFADEGSKDPERRCLTVTLEAASGRHWPWMHPPVYTFAWYLHRDGRWTFQGYGVPDSEIQAAHARSTKWRHA